MTAPDHHVLENYFPEADNALPDNFNLKIGGIGLTVHASRDSLFEAALAKYSQFLTTEVFSESVCFYDVRTLPDPEGITRSFDIYKEIHTVSVDRRLFVSRWDLFGIIDLSGRTGKFILFNNTFMTYESIIRIFYSLLAVENNGFLIHSSSLVHNGKGYVFFGVSGSGKSTVVKLSGPDDCLTDELALIKKGENGYVTAGTPFHGELPLYMNATAGLAGMFFLKKSPTTWFRKMDRSEIYPILLRNVLFFSDDWELRKKIFGTVVDLAGLVDIYEMNFEKNNTFWRIIDNGFES